MMSMIVLKIAPPKTLPSPTSPWQLNLMPLTERHANRSSFDDSINSDGFLDADLDEITKTLAEELEDLEHDEVECVLHQIQSLDPVNWSRDCRIIKFNWLRRLL